MLHSQDLLHLKFHDFLNFFPAHIRAAILNKSETRQCKSGEVIFKRGEEGAWMGGIMAGRVRIVLRGPHGQEMFLSIFERNEIFGERALLDQLPRGADAIAEGETTFLIMKREEMMPLLFQYPESMFCLVQVLCNRLLRYTETMQLYSMHNLPTRLASYLLFLARIYGVEEEGHTIIRTGLNQSDLGQKLAATRESINRQLKQFSDKKLIDLSHNKIIILDSAGLEAICDSSL